MQADVQPFFHADTHTFSYVLSDPASGHAAIIDPVLDYDPVTARSSTHSAQILVDYVSQHGLQVHWLLETHAHADHLSAAGWLRERYLHAPICIGEGICMVQQALAPSLDLPLDFSTDGSQFDRLWRNGDAFMVGQLPARVIAVPGHTSDSNAYLIGDALFTGDSLFMPDGGTARCDFPGGDAATLFASIQRLFELPDSTRVFICHDYGPGGRAAACETSIGEQRARNIHVRDGCDAAGFAALRNARDATLAAPALILPSLRVNLQAGRMPEAGTGTDAVPG